MQEVDWSKLSHAYGEASGVPGTIARLTSVSPGVRENALRGLYGNIYHQGTVYSATGPAAALLIELLRDPEVPDREAILRLLYHLATGWGDAEHKESIWEVVKEGSEALLGVLENGDAAERLGVVSLLASCGEAAFAKLVAQYEDEEEPAVRAAVALSVARLGLSAADVKPFFALPRDSDPVAQLARHLSQASLSPEAMQAAELDELAGRINDGSWAELQAHLRGYWHGEFNSPVSYLSSLEREQLDRVLPALASHVESLGDPDEALRFVSALLASLFAEVDEGAELVVSDLDDGQRRLLESIARADACWVYGNMAMTLGDYGVRVWSPEELAAFLDIELPPKQKQELRPEQEAVAPTPDPVCLPQEELDEAQLQRLNRFVELMDEADWLEAANWHQVGLTGITVSPCGFARRFCDEVNVDLGYWFVDDETAVANEYLRLLVGSKTSSHEFIIIYIIPAADELDAILQLIIEEAPSLSFRVLSESFLQELVIRFSSVALELPDGERFAISPVKD